MHRKALGKGLEALIPGAAATEMVDPPGQGSRDVRIDEVATNPFQPRTKFDDDGIRELADSIKATGVIQPVIVRRGPDGGYQLIAGERRLRASTLAGRSTVPAIVRDADDREMLELALIENVQREDLNPIDEARGYQAVLTQVGLTHDEVSQKVGKHRSAITNALRLLGLPPEVQDMVSRGTLTAGHARALLGLPSPGDQLAAARYVQSKGFSVRRTEALIQRKLRRQHSRPRSKSADITDLENRLQQRFATRVTIRMGRKGGRVEFEYYSREDLERLLEAWSAL
jgi:ParB family chromosome partitioning protein